MTAVEDREAYQREDGLTVIPREQFARDHFDYKPGQHVVFAGPTQRGKTRLGFKLLEYTATPDMPAYVSVCKPTDKVTAEEGKRLGYRRTHEWPVPPKLKEYWEGKPSGYLIWPDMSDPSSAMGRAADSTRDLIRDTYSAGSRGKKCILFLDDTVTKSLVLGLDRDMIMVLTMSGAMGIGGWCFVQKPTSSGKTALWSYSQSEHIFITRDPDKRNRERYGEIGGFDTAQVNKASQLLKPYQFLYLERTHGYMCVVDAS